MNTKKHTIYLDYQSTTPLDPEVLIKMQPYMTEFFGNPHSLEHKIGWDAQEAVEYSQHVISQFLNCLPDEVYFTSGATESNNLLILGLASKALEKKLSRKKILISSIEHKSILGPAKFLENSGFIVNKIPVLENGIIDIDQFSCLLSDDVLLVSIMTTNNEIGTNQPIKKIGELCKKNNILFHTDASQGIYTNLDIIENNIDFLSLSGHKLYGPKGIGILFINNNAGLQPKPLFYGGEQQNAIRPGTIPPFLTIGIAESIKKLISIKENEILKLQQQRELLLEGLKSYCNTIEINGTINNRHPGNLNLLIPTIESKRLIYILQPLVAISTGSACTSGEIEPSHVLQALGLSNSDIDHSLRISIGRFTRDAEIEKAIEFIGKKIKQ